MHILFLLAIPYLAIAYRCRGGAFPLPNTTLARILYWALPVGLVVFFDALALHLSLWVVPVCALLAFGGSTIGHGSEQAQSPPDENIAMGCITLVMLILILLPMGVAYKSMGFPGSSPLIYAPLGALGWPAYVLGYKIPWSIPKLCNAKTTEWGELLTGGFAFGLPLALAGMLA